ncbi:MAG: uroporphyrinogen decarboxylase family protein [Armatimonadia bacterium]
MTYYERILAALRFEEGAGLAWVPRLDLWYNANRYCGTLPEEWREASLAEITRELGVGTHAVIPDFLDTEEPDEVWDRALGLDHVRNQPYRVRFRRTERIVEREGDRTRVTYKLPAGELSAVLRYGEGMRRAGVTLVHVEERVVKTLDDYRVLGALFEDVVVEVDGGRYGEYAAEVGDEGVVVALASVSASPVHHLLKEVVPYDRLYFDLYDHPEVIADTAKAMAGYFEQVVGACAQSEAELVLLGANYDLMVTPPPMFEAHIAPWLKEAAERLHGVGKLLVTHTDGENDKLNGFYVECGVDVADSVCPAPMTRLSLEQYRRDFEGEVAIWGGLCSVCVLGESMTEEQFEAHVGEAIAAAGDGKGIVLSLADTTPPGAEVGRLRRIGEMVGESLSGWTG